MSWRIDPILAAIDRERFDLFSIDLFETMLLRPTGQVDDGFTETGRRAALRGLLAAGLTPPLFAALRRRAAQLAEIELPGRVITLADIYHRIPRELVDTVATMALEVDTEADLISLNPCVAGFVADLAAAGVPVVACSDMYLSSEQITAILARAGGDPAWFKSLYVSCELGTHKRDGGLFRCLLGDFPTVSPPRICHIGDDPVADGAAPRRLGVTCIDYGVPFRLGRIVERERTVAGGRWETGADPARRLAARHVGDEKGESAFWRDLGATIIAPVLVRYAAFVVEECRRLGIRHIAAMMREGRLLSRLIAGYAERRGYDMIVFPLYVSRLALAATEAPRWDRAFLTDLFERRPHIRLGDLLARGDAPPPPSLAGLSDLLVEQIANLRLSDGEPVVDALAAWLGQPKTAATAQRVTEEAQRATVGYLRQVFGDAPTVALVDLGARATTAAHIRRLAGIGDHYPLHAFLLYATEQVTTAITDGLPLSLYAGGDRDALQIGKILYRSPHAIERLLTGLDDCTAGYRVRDDGAYEPVSVPTAARGDERAAILAFEDGVNRYWQCWSQLETKGAPTNRLDDLVPWYALLQMPSVDEASNLGALNYDYNDGSNWVRPICDAAAVSAARAVLAGPEALLSARLFGLRPPMVPWPQGAATLVQHDALRRYREATMPDPGHGAICATMVERMRRQGVSRIVVYAAGGSAGMGPAFLDEARDAGIDVTAYLDWFPDIVGSTFHDVPVIAARSLPAYRGQPIALVTLGYRDAMLEELGHIMGADLPLVFTLDDQ